jgi:hypothetical protein
MTTAVHPASAIFTAVFLVLLCGPGDIRAQEMVPVDILSLYGSIPRPPGTVEEAYGRAQCAPRQGCSADEHYAAVGKTLGELQARLLQLTTVLQESETHPLAGVDPAKLEQRLAAMSQAEQMQFAMELERQQATGNTPVVEPARVQAVMRETAAIREAIGAEGMALSAGAMPSFFPDGLAGALREDLGRIESEVNARRAAVPAPNEQGPSAAIVAYERQIRDIEHDGMTRRLAAQAEYQRALADAWHRHLITMRDRFAALQSMLPGIGYGQAARGAAAKLDIVIMQSVMLEVAIELAQASYQATERGAAMWLAKLEFDEQWQQ